MIIKLDASSMLHAPHNVDNIFFIDPHFENQIYITDLRLTWKGYLISKMFNQAELENVLIGVIVSPIIADHGVWQ